MSDEIKEILDRIKNYPEKLYCLNNKEKTILLNYITNLQQELNNQIEIANNRYVEIAKLKQKLSEKSKILTYDYTSDVYEELEDYKSRVEKAIEKVNNISFQVNGLKNQPAVLYINLKDTSSGKDLLNLLQGGKDDNEKKEEGK